MTNMNRREFLAQTALGTAGILGIAAWSTAMEEQIVKTGDMPVLFVGHGSPMNAKEDNEFSRAWTNEGALLPRPPAILCISAHWETEGTFVGTTPKPEMIYDFYGFPDELYKMTYPCPGAPEWADRVRRTVEGTKVIADPKRGLDHGTWVVLRRMFPKFDIPVFQMSLDRRKTPQEHYDLGRQLLPLREKGLLIIGSGNMVHNLGMMEWRDGGFDWAVEFDRKLTELIEKRDLKALIDYPELGESAKKAIPTNEHYLPLLYTLALRRKDEKLWFFADKVTLGSISMRSIRIG